MVGWRETRMAQVKPSISPLGSGLCLDLSYLDTTRVGVSVWVHVDVLVYTSACGRVLVRVRAHNARRC